MSRSVLSIIMTFILLLSGLLGGCASPPPKAEKSYWQLTAETYMQDGLKYYQRQQFRQAMNSFTQALTTYQRYHDVQGELSSRINLAKVNIVLNQLDVADSQIAEARRQIENYGFNKKTIHLDIMASSIAIRRYSLRAAAEILNRYSEDAPQPDNIDAALLVNKIRLGFLQQQDVDSLLDRLTQVVVKIPAYQPRLWRFEAQLADTQKRFAETDDLYAKTLQQYQQDADSIGVIATLQEWGESFARRGEWDTAKLKLEAMYKVAVSVKLQYQMVEALRGLVLVYRKLGDWDKVEWAKGQIAAFEEVD